MTADAHFWWYATRAAGVTSFVLLALSVWLGLGASTRIFDGLLDRPWVYEVHKFSSLLALAFVGVHLVALLLDSYIGYTIGDLLIPGVSNYRPAAVAAGILGLYLTAAIAGTLYLRARLGYRGWRVFHYASFGAFALVLTHGLFAGTDSPTAWMRWTYWFAATATSYLVIYRILRAVSRWFHWTPERTPPREAGLDRGAPARGGVGRPVAGRPA